MNHFQPFAQVSALDNPLPELLHKRQFTPASSSIFGDSRRRKLENGVQAYQSQTFPVNSTFPPGHCTSQSSCSLASTCFTDSAEICPQSQDIKLTERQKFKARPLPRSTYQPFAIQKAKERQVTVPHEFHLTSPSPKKILDSGKIEKFKARPMPDFSKPWIPFFTPTKNNNPEGPSQNLSNSCIKHYSSFNREEKPNFHCKSKSKGSDFRFSTQEINSSGENSRKLCRNHKTSKDFQSFNNEKSHFDPVIPMDIELHSTKRAKDRELFQERLQEINRKKEAELQAEARAQALQEEQELRQIRKQAEFKARPMPNFQRVLDWNKNGSYEDQSTAFASSVNDTMMDIEY